MLQVGRPARVWHRRLATRLEAAGHRVSLRLCDARPLPFAARATLAAERRLYGRRCAALARADSWAATRADAPGDLCLHLAGPVPPEPALDLAFDGRAGDAAMLEALLGGRAPRVTARVDDICYAAGLPAIETPWRLHRTLDAVLERLETLLVQAVDAYVAERPAASMPSAPLTPRRAGPVLWRGIQHKLTRRFGLARGRPDHWCIVVRATNPEPLGSGCIIPDDGARFYADPFVWRRDGRTCVFFEDFPYASRKGVIGVVDLDAFGAPGAPRTVLEQPVHLSYPFLWEEGGAIYMMPEMSVARRLQLFRADPFPDRWVEDRILIEGAALSDATIVRHEGRYWIFATIAAEGDSTWDQLALYHAPTLFGPWTAHPGNPVLIDAGAARPAGAMWHETGHLMRVAQDCRAGYGTGLAVCRVDRLDEASFAQTVVRRVEPPQRCAAAGIHTWNRFGGLEVVDLRVAHER